MFKKIITSLKKRRLYIILSIVYAVIILYISDLWGFRSLLLDMDIDANFIIGFTTLVALVYSLIQNLEDRKFNYNMNIIDSLKDKGTSIVAKLLTVRHNSQLFLSTIKNHKKAIISRNVYVDLNNTLTRDDIENGMELVGAYIQMYFSEESENWNTILDNLNLIATYSANITQNYTKNIDLINDQSIFYNEFLNNIDDYISKSEAINTKIDSDALNMFNRIISKIDENGSKVKDGFY